MFKVGQKVVCINDDGINGLPVLFIKKGQIYTVTGFYICQCCKAETLKLKGIDAVSYQVCICGAYKEERSYVPSRFRPLDETFATEVLEQIKEQIEQEELVTI